MFKLMMQRALGVNRKVYVCFVDYEKAFDRVRHHHMLEVLKNLHIDKEDLCFIHALYWNQKSNVRIRGLCSKEFRSIQRGVRQGCPLSPALFNAFSEKITSSPKWNKIGFKIGGQRVKDINYADDKVLTAETPQQLQQMVTRLDTDSKKSDMSMNTKKTKVMVISKTATKNPLRIVLNDMALEQVNRYPYLGVQITSDGRDEIEIKHRIGLAKQAFNNYASVLRNRKMKLPLRRRILHCYVWTVLRYGSETWTITKYVEKRVNDFELWCYRKMQRISWTERVRNEDVLKRIGIKETILLNHIKEAKSRFVEKMKTEDIFKTAMQGKIPGKSSRGRKRLTMLSNV